MNHFGSWRPSASAPGPVPVPLAQEESDETRSSGSETYMTNTKSRPSLPCGESRERGMVQSWGPFRLHVTMFIEVSRPEELLSTPWRCALASVAAFAARRHGERPWRRRLEKDE